MSGLRIVVSGMVAGDPYQGGATWAVLQYVLGLRALGHDVLLVEPIERKTYVRHARTLAESRNAEYFAMVVRRFALEQRATLLCEATQETVGLDYASLVRRVFGADVLINISGMLTDVRLLETIGRRVYLDLDPVFVQLWDAAEGVDMRFGAHTHFVTVGLGIGTPACPIPTCGRDWIKTLQPLALEYWPVHACPAGAAWTTVANWRGYGSVQHDGVTYGQKVHSFRRLFELPSKTRAKLRPALAIHPNEASDLAALASHGWTFVTPTSVASTPDEYQTFIRSSRGELGVAKSGYVDSRSGWFSDRSVCYLATGRPVVAHNTGFGSAIPTGEGLIAFSTAEEAASGIDAVEADYMFHSRRAREIACDSFRADLVLPRLLDLIGATYDDASHRRFAGPITGPPATA